ncbi:2-desacetyl-2-hydroxyethyl bacteriochlorophyllide A dehydrogenase [Cohnella phaseoli]|uniref:2-desacetyl-2-hydroxyethyl bacteriochlorophyllide A dehydrogenase n=2 Tax=Paenibacillaceae TaxID=186822 RepID=A0A3D9KNH5_9BACL|nr:2-desacetyl-2-hydroxyethyl bacteriochlorophyllide A dehydrogenase [Cohnella phaseoli]
MVGGKGGNESMIEGKMKALVYEGPKTMKMREVDVPRPAEDEVLIRVAAAGICGSELSGYLGHNSLRKPPLVMGHEFAGTIAAVGARVSKFAVGDRVTANPLVSCGSCSDCRAGHANLCAARSLIGAGRPGAFAEYVAVPEGNLYALPDSLSFEEGALAEPLACAVRIARLARVSPEDSLLVVGAGPIGLLTLIAARIHGVRSVAVMDLNADRLSIVEQLGGIALPDAQTLERLKPPRGFDKAVDAVGLDATRQTCMLSTRPGGRVVLSGLHSADSSLPVNAAIRNELTLLGSFGYNPIDFDAALQWLSDGLVDLAPWTEIRPLDQGGECFEQLLGNPGAIAKMMLQI